jgi:nucleotide-binding universal stress UspA family protein
MIRKIVVPVDGSVHANVAVDWACDLAIKYQAPLLLLHVITVRGSGTLPEEFREYAKMEGVEITDWDIIESEGRGIVNAAEKRAQSRGAKEIETAIAFGNPAEVILERSKKFGADLIVMGRRGLGPLPALFLGSVSSKVVHLADCACLTVR